MAISEKRLQVMARDMGLEHIPLDRVWAFLLRRSEIQREAKDAIDEIASSLDDAYRALFLEPPEDDG